MYIKKYMEKETEVPNFLERYNKMYYRSMFFFTVFAILKVTNCTVERYFSMKKRGEKERPNLMTD